MVLVLPHPKHPPYWILPEAVGLMRIMNGVQYVTRLYIEFGSNCISDHARWCRRLRWILDNTVSLHHQRKLRVYSVIKFRWDLVCCFKIIITFSLRWFGLKMHRRLAYTKPAMCHAHPSPLGTGQDEVRGRGENEKERGDEWEQTGKNRRAGE